MSRLFNGTSDYLEQLAAPVTAYPMSFCCWFKKPSTIVNSVMVSIDTTTGVCRVTNFSQSTAEVSSNCTAVSGTAAQAVKGSYTANTWHHCANVFNNSADRKVYLDGVAGAVNTAGIAISGLDHFHISTRYNSSVRQFFMDGDLAEIAVWNTTLSQADINSLAKGFSPKLIRPTFLKAYVPIIRELQNYNSGIMTASGTTASSHPRIFY